MGRFLKTVAADYQVNRGNYRPLASVLLYRVANMASRARKRSALHNLWAVPILLAYRIFSEFVWSYEIPAATQIGMGLMLDHGYGIVINKHSEIGDFARIKHHVTIGCKTLEDGGQGPSPRIGAHVDIGAGAILLGDIRVGNYVRVGAGSVVVKDVPDKADVAGNPAKVIRIRS